MSTTTTGSITSPKRTRTRNSSNHVQGSVSGRSHVLKGESKTPTPKPTPTTGVQCDLCYRRFGNSHALKMHIEMSSSHKKSSQAVLPASKEKSMARPTVTAIDQDRGTRVLISHPPKQQQTAVALFSCDLCRRSFVTEKALDMHRKHAKQHRSPVSKTNSGQDSRRNGNGPDVITSTVGAASSSNVHVSSGTKQNMPDTPQQKRLWCSVCSRHFHTETGLQRHVETSIEHKANLGISNGRTKQGISTATSPLTSYIQPESSVTKGSSTAEPNQMDDSIYSPSHPKQESSLHSPGEAAVQDPRDTAYHSVQKWSEIPGPLQGTVLKALREQCHPPEHLSRNGYHVRPLTPDEIDGYRKCKNCGFSKKRIDNESRSECRFHPQRQAFQRGIIRGGGRGECARCGEKGGKGCYTFPSHNFAAAEAKLSQFRETPAHRPDGPVKRAAVVIDCEMVGVAGGQSEVVRLCAVDFLTGQVLTDIYVTPKQKVIAWRTKVSGVTEAILLSMQRQGKTVDGWQAARALLWEHIDKDTILIGHALNNDLNVLGMVHSQIVDSAILTKIAVSGPNCSRSWGLKTLCQQFLDREIQIDATGHNCMEDTFATREVLLWCLRNPEKLRLWAISERDILEKELAAKKEREKRKGKADAEGKGRRSSNKDLPQTTSVAIAASSNSDSADGLEDVSDHSDGVLVD
ncbi:hypothetical protein VTN77DRAFT_1126 [Rasamsonia byssochlamydoides]|uniref:uncharacterized protein n=1 Tax=Rasamsonia byssochlamydoides TaxID=89139 RepID=UPI003742270E